MSIHFDQNINNQLNEKGYACIGKILSDSDCDRVASWYEDENLFRATIEMERFRFGKGTYKYFKYPLPEMVADLRSSYYQKLVVAANAWMSDLNVQYEYPPDYDDFIQVNQRHRQVRPTPLLLKYEAGGFNRLHQDRYGEIYFPFQLVVVLSQQHVDFEGGQFVLTESVPRTQARAHVCSPDKGEAIIFTTQYRPVRGTRGYFRSTFKHGVSDITSGTRFALGVIFHDAE